ncbi:substrate-binding domain-containing protein [Jiella sp. MQZ9-1]|uniref:Substrate-binding domain-containing protein n=1 Tax=Jiella flava TaxID=2816857 RepID=A0A939JTV5_9HYPH|nr:substrate-binding domain-containing protein [Jiella flava]MBO0662525.1 substrate-binding domain-containing protein [Jiella flava]MCD2471750.1 substrate-binding domain-containing protein [Jiella flava]
MRRIGLLLPQSGPSGIWAPSAEACATLAIEEINAQCGLLGGDVDLLVIDAGESAMSAAEAVDFSIDVDEIDALIGMMPSYQRAAASSAIGGRVPFIYTPQFEGLERDRAIVTVGETSRELLEPGIDWLFENRGAERYFLVGNDYVWPRETLATARRLIGERGGSVVGERLVPFGYEDYDRLFGEITASQADVVVPYFLGAEAVSFNRSFAEAGLAAKVLRFSSAIDETVIFGIGAEATENLYVSSGYFGVLDSRNNRSFLERYHARFGDNPPPSNAFGQSCYEGIYCLLALAEAAGDLAVPAVIDRLGRACQRNTARGFDTPTVAGERQPIHLAAVDGLDITLLR